MCILVICVIKLYVCYMFFGGLCLFFSINYIVSINTEQSVNRGNHFNNQLPYVVTITYIAIILYSDYILHFPYAVKGNIIIICYYWLNWLDELWMPSYPICLYFWGITICFTSPVQLPAVRESDRENWKRGLDYPPTVPMSFEWIPLWWGMLLWSSSTLEFVFVFQALYVDKFYFRNSYKALQNFIWNW